MTLSYLLGEAGSATILIIFFDFFNPVGNCHLGYACGPFRHWLDRTGRLLTVIYHDAHFCRWALHKGFLMVLLS